jgi:hypothetical protein
MFNIGLNSGWWLVEVEGTIVRAERVAAAAKRT